ncbi:MAG: hypothetical protein ACE3L7_01500 [Candidatus Pristimantibacillus sp.]
MNKIFKEINHQTIDPLLKIRMEKIVKKTVIKEKFQKDFYNNDLKEMESCSLFAWYVYDCGTHFIPLSNMEAIRAFQSEWVATMKGLKNNKEIDGLYVCDVKTSQLKQLYYFDEGTLEAQIRAVI